MCPSSLIHTAETPTGDGGSFLEKVELSRCIMALYRPKFASSLSLPRHVIAIFLMGVRRGWIRPGTLAIVVHGNKKGPGRANRFPSSLLTLPRPPTSTLARVVLPSTKFVLPCLSAHGPEADGGESLRRDSGHVRRIYSCERARARRRVAYDRPRAHLRPSFRVFEFCRFSTRYAAPPFPFSPPRSPSCPPPSSSTFRSSPSPELCPSSSTSAPPPRGIPFPFPIETCRMKFPLNPLRPIPSPTRPLLDQWKFERALGLSKNRARPMSLAVPLRRGTLRLRPLISLPR